MENSFLKRLPLFSHLDDDTLQTISKSLEKRAYDKNEVVLIKQFRKPAEQEIFEIPAGLVEKGETDPDAVKRELEEETGFKAGKIEKLFEAYASPGYSSEVIQYYLARGLKKTKQNLDPDEMIEVQLVPFESSLKMIASGEIRDNKTILAILFAKEFVL